MSTKGDKIVFRSPRAGDAKRIWELVRAGDVLELNSAYCYLLLCTHFAGSGLIADRGEELAGFVTAYRPPNDPEAVFVWQIGVSPAGRGCGLGSEMLNRLIDCPDNRGARYLNATVEPGNEASNRLFGAFARIQNVPLETSEGFGSELFPTGHAPEPLLRIGPLPARAVTRSNTRRHST